MMRALLAAEILLTLSLRAGAQPPPSPAFWPQWRGPLGTGVAPDADPPTEWSEEKNIRWKVDLPGRGHATPIIWGDRVFLQTAVPTGRKVEPAPAPDAQPPAPTPDPARRGGPAASDAALGQDRPAEPQDPDRPRGTGQPPGRGGPPGEGGPPGRGGFPGRGPASKPTEVFKFTVLALDRATGKPVWERVVREEVPHEAGHQTASQASCSPVTDGQHVYAAFGSRGVYCLTMDGQVKWEKDLGDMQTRAGFGEGSSPAIHGDTLVINWDHEGGSFIVALDRTTGSERWRKDRDEPTSWATPLIVEHGGKAQVITSATKRVRSYDLATGELLWECGGMTGNVIPTPVFGDGLVYALSGYRGNALLAIRLDAAKGDVTGGSAIAFSYDKDAPYVPSPLLSDGRLYFFQQTTGILTCLNARSGEKLYGPQRLETLKSIYASPVAARGRVYCAGRNGHTIVFKDAPSFEVLADNVLDDAFNASPAVVGRELYLRGEKRLYCIAAN